jgi:hypothetical protein
VANRKGYFELYQQYKKSMNPEAARLRAMTESGTNPKKMARDDLAAAKAQTKREMAEKPAKSWVPKLKEGGKKELKKESVSIREQQDELLRRNLSAADYKRLKGR